MNTVNLVGRLTRDPELFEGENSRAKFSIAISGYNDRVDYINCTSFGKQAENIGKYCKKGSLVSIEGSLNSYSYDNEEGKRVSGMQVLANRVQFLSSPSTTQSRTEERAEEQELLTRAFEEFGEQMVIEDTEDLPF